VVGPGAAPPPAASTAEADVALLLPRVTGPLMVAARSARLAAGALRCRFGRGAMPPVYRLRPMDSATAARVALRLGHIIIDGPPPVGSSQGCLWREKVCAACPGAPTLDGTHHVAECALTAEPRRAAFAEAAQLAREWCGPDGVCVEADSVAALEQVAAGEGSVQYRAFALLAACGDVLRRTDVAKGLSPPLAALLLAPPREATNAQQRASSAAVNVALRAFGQLAAAAVRPLPVPDDEGGRRPRR